MINYYSYVKDMKIMMLEENKNDNSYWKVVIMGNFFFLLNFPFSEMLHCFIKKK